MPDEPGQLGTNAVLAAIRRAFEGVCLGRGLTLEDAQRAELGQPPRQRNAADIHQQGSLSWEQIDPRANGTFGDELYHLDAQGLRYFLPAWMTAAIRGMGTDDEGDAVHRAAIGVLTLADDGSPLRKLNESFSVFTVDQLRACAMFLALSEAGEGAALESHVAIALRHTWWAHLPEAWQRKVHADHPWLDSLA